MIYKKKKQSLPDRMLNILFKFYFMHEVTSMIWIPLQILCVAEMSAAWPVSILTSSLLTQSVYCWQQQCATATYNSFPLIDRFSNLEKKKWFREKFGGKENIPLAGHSFALLFFFSSLPETRMRWLELQQADIFQPQSDCKDGSYIIRNSTTEGWKKLRYW